jgi:hypothetical protein
VPILHRRNLRIRKVKWLSQHHTAHDVWGQDYSPGPLASRLWSLSISRSTYHTKTPEETRLYFSVLGFELRASCWLGRHFTTWTTLLFLLCFGYFRDRVLWTICWLQTPILLISACRVARMRGVSHPIPSQGWNLECVSWEQKCFPQRKYLSRL